MPSKSLRSRRKVRSKNSSRIKIQSRGKRSKSAKRVRSKSASRIKSSQKSTKPKKLSVATYILPPLSDYTSVKKIGEGEGGKVYLLCKGRKCVARKMIQVNNYTEVFDHEIKMHKKFEKIKLAPKLYGYGMILKGKSKYGAIDMEPISGTFYDLLKTSQSKKTLDWIVSSVNRILRQMCKHGIVHGDAHIANFAYKNLPNGKRKALLIDFGLSCCINKTECNERLEYMKLIETLDIGNQNNLGYLRKQFQTIYDERFRSSSKTDNEINKEYDQLFQDDFGPPR